MRIETRKGTDPTYSIYGVVGTEYERRNGYWYGWRLLCLVHHCPNRYWARKAAAYWLKGKITAHGWSYDYFARQDATSMPKTEEIHFDEIAFGIGYHKHVQAIKEN